MFKPIYVFAFRESNSYLLTDKAGPRCLQQFADRQELEKSIMLRVHQMFEFQVGQLNLLRFSLDHCSDEKGIIIYLLQVVLHQKQSFTSPFNTKNDIMIFQKFYIFSLCTRHPQGNANNKMQNFCTAMMSIFGLNGKVSEYQIKRATQNWSFFQKINHCESNQILLLTKIPPCVVKEKVYFSERFP